tara:strand:- start:3705 stop:4823 length:1119 start_codon:yes stop_codon:yes gene_type:complete
MSTENHIESMLRYEPFELDADEKSKVFGTAMHEAFKHHTENNELFSNYCLNQGFKLDKMPETLADYPYLAVNVFKKKRLISVPEDEIKTVLNSSATTGTPSTVVLDFITSKRQIFASAKVMAHYLGNHRRPFLILDDDPIKSHSSKISARGAATTGFLMLSSRSDYFVTSESHQLNLDIDKLEKAINNYEDSNQEICVFGFTFILYHCAVKALKEKGVSFKLPANSKIVHIGGWKKLEAQKVTKEQFVRDVSDVLGVSEDNIFDFYGFTEQMGLLYVSLGFGLKTVPLYSEIIIRDYQSLEPVKDGNEGLIQILTPLPHSYPGISVLTEDVGRITGRGKDSQGRIGTQFEVLGRAKKAEARGCGDIMAEFIA